MSLDISLLAVLAILIEDFGLDQLGILDLLLLGLLIKLLLLIELLATTIL